MSDQPEAEYGPRRAAYDIKKLRRGARGSMSIPAPPGATRTKAFRLAVTTAEEN
jgi:ribosomal protein S6